MRLFHKKKQGYKSQFYPDCPPEEVRQQSRDQAKTVLYTRFLPKTWEEFKEYSRNDQLQIALILSLVVELVLSFERSEFVQGVLQEYEWDLADVWEYCCDTCDLPFIFCKC